MFRSQHKLGKVKQYHEKLGHIGIKRLKEAAKRNLLPGISAKDVKPFFCEVCVRGKMKKASFQKLSLSRSKKPMERQCMDIAGPFKYLGTGGNRYYLLTVDDYTGWTTISHHRDLANMSPRIKEHYARLPALPKYIRLDHAGSFDSKLFRQWAADNNIALEYCQPRRHQQNGCAEAGIGAVNQMARCMMVHSGLPPKYWTHAVEYAAFVRNRVPSRPGVDSPYSRVFKKTPKIDMLGT